MTSVNTVKPFPSSYLKLLLFQRVYNRDLVIPYNVFSHGERWAIGKLRQFQQRNVS